ncbi:MAG: hypothetical protein J6N76_02435, partial [Lachnospiraceae bacterium]|nr:hypothetical protein [Lachnospiraceae bacterium]
MNVTVNGKMREFFGKQEPWVILLFAIVRYISSTLKQTLDQRMILIYGNERALLFHYVWGIMLAVGITIYVVLRRRGLLKGNSAVFYRSSIFTAIILTILIYLTKSTPLLVTEAIALELLVGIISGMTFYRAYLCLYGSPYIGRLTALAFVIAILPQSPIVKATARSGIGILVVTAALILFMGVHERILAIQDALVQTPMEMRRHDTRTDFDIRRELSCLIGIMILSEISLFFIEYIITHRIGDTTFYGSFYEWNRLFFPLGYVIAGFCLDYFGRCKISVLLFSALLISMVLSGLIYTPDYGSYAIIVFYLVLGICYEYGVVNFIECAGASNNPELWSSVEWILIEVVDFALYFVPTMFFEAELSNQVVGIVCILGVGILILI